jgi:hypothetical protein
MMLRSTASVLFLALLAACTPQRDAKLDAARAYIRETQGRDMEGLRVTINTASSDGRKAVQQPVHGVRYVVNIYEYGDPTRILDRWQKEVDTTLDPDEGKMMRLEIESMYFGRSGASPFIVEAHPVKLGDQEMPPPEGWR